MNKGHRRWGDFCPHPEQESHTLLLPENAHSQSCDRWAGPSHSLLRAAWASGWVGTVCGGEVRRCFVLESWHAAGPQGAF